MNASIETPGVTGPVRRHLEAEAPSLLTVTETAKLLRISRNLCYELIAQGRLPHVRLGRVIRVPRHGLDGWIARETGLPSTAPDVVSYRPQQH